MALVAWARPARDWPMSTAIAVGLSVAIWPLVYLWASIAGLAFDATGATTMLVLCGVVSVAGFKVRGVPLAGGWHSVALLVIVGAAVGLRLAQAAPLVAPAWVDGLHHTQITLRLMEARGIPETLRPYMPVDRFYYHFGFHALAAAVAGVARIGAPSAVLVTGQMLSGLACLTVYALARAVRVRPDAALAAAAVPATLYFFPMYFLAWSRFTQLAGLVVLPVAWVLVARALARPRVSAVACAAIASAGLVLVHYRVGVFFACGVAVMAVCALFARGRPRAQPTVRTLAVLGSTAGLGLVLAWPWLGRNVTGGVRDLSAAASELAQESTAAPPAGGAAGSLRWYEVRPGALDVPSWLYTERFNSALVVIGALGLVAAAVRRQPAAWWLLATCLVALIMTRPELLGLPPSWLVPGFSAAISLFVPVGIGVALALEGAARLVSSRRYGRPDIARSLRAAIVLVAVGGALELGANGPRPVDVLTADTVIVEAADLVAAEWIRAATPPEARFLVAATHWHLGTFRGVDGGYWLPVTTGRGASMPGGLYSFGDPDDVRRLTDVGERSERGDAMTDAELEQLMTDTGSTYVYVGPAGAETGGKLSARRLASVPFLEEVYSGDGVRVFARR
jgi:hypothetical protein